MDGISVALRRPTLAETSTPRYYYNRKGFNSVNLQATCDSHYRITISRQTIPVALMTVPLSSPVCFTNYSRSSRPKDAQSFLRKGRPVPVLKPPLAILNNVLPVSVSHSCLSFELPSQCPPCSTSPRPLINILQQHRQLEHPMRRDERGYALHVRLKKHRRLLRRVFGLLRHRSSAP